ncbi:hypothetical protein ACFL20_00715 [Spirochaetota bacterium]
MKKYIILICFFFYIMMPAFAQGTYRDQFRETRKTNTNYPNLAIKAEVTGIPVGNAMNEVMPGSGISAGLFWNYKNFQLGPELSIWHFYGNSNDQDNGGSDSAKTTGYLLMVPVTAVAAYSFRVLSSFSIIPNVFIGGSSDFLSYVPGGVSIIGRTNDYTLKNNLHFF